MGESEERNSGEVIAVCIGPGGIQKHAVQSAHVTESGLVGDAHRYSEHGGRDRAVCLLSLEDYRSMARDGVQCQPPGCFGENILTEGLGLSALRPGDRLRVGSEVVLELADVRAPCVTLRSVDHRFPALMLGRSGFVCRVVTPGHIKPRMEIEMIRW